MKKLFTIIFALLITFLQFSCKKDSNGTPISKANVQSITSSGQSIYYTYDANSRIIQSRFKYGNGILTSDYTYLSGKLKTIKPDLNIVPYKSYEYDGNGILTAILMFENFANNNKLYRKFELSYNAQGKLSKKVEIDSEQNTRNTLTFEYNIDGLLSKIHVVSDETTGDITIGSYSDECNFDPYAVSEFATYSDYFSPELFIGAKRLPTKINYLFDDGSKIDRENVIVIINKQIKSLTGTDTQIFKYMGELKTTHLNWVYSFNY